MNDQKKILVSNELKVLEGRNKINILILAGILLLSFIGLGHSIGGLKYLSKRMDNPFTKWVNLPINSAFYNESNDLQRYFASKEIRDTFMLDTIRGYKRDAYRFVSPDGSKVQFKRTRTIDMGEDLLQEIIKPSNLANSHISGDIESQFGHCWLIVKESVLNELGFNMPVKNIDKIELRQTWAGERSFSLFIPIIAVVKDLPDQVDMIIPEHLDALLDGNFDSGYIDVTESNNWRFLSDQSITKESVQQALGSEEKLSDLVQETLTLNGVEKKLYTVYMAESKSLSQKFVLFDYLKEEINVSPYHQMECNIGKTLYVKNAQYLAMNFKDLRNVRSFRDRIMDEFGFEITLNQIEDKENFSLVTRLTILLAFILLLVSLTGVIIFIANLLISHFNQIQSNLGTFKAFGLSNKRLLSDYTYITLLFLSGH
ncbi:MAG: hypothetical protein IPN97_09805 [Saprospiraceae bacterium]|nr:hypothetical protein [Saprospiraceae bacterium]